MKKILLFIAFINISLSAFAQNAIVGTGFSTGWGGGSCPTGNTNFKPFSLITGTGATGSYGVTTTANGTGNQYFRMGVDWSTTTAQLTITPGSDVTVAPNTTYSLNTGCTTSGAMLYSVPNATYNYVFKTLNAGTAPTGTFTFFEVQGTVQTVSSVTRGCATTVVGGAMTITANLSGALSTGQAVYLRYTNNAFSTSTVVQMTGSGTTYTAPIPAGTNTANANVAYYVFTSGTANVAANGSNADLYTINLNNNGGSNYTYTVPASAALNGTYTVGAGQCFTDIASTVTYLNTNGVSGAVTINVPAGYTETAPSGGFSITATGTAANTITFKKSGTGTNPTFTAFTPQASGILSDAVFKIVGGDYITIDGFTLQENAANTTTAAGTNNMTEWGIALLYAITTNGCQNITLQNNTITLNRTYQNTFGIYANSVHAATTPTTSATATGATGGNHNLKIYSNNISNINNGILIIGPTAAADLNTGLDIGGTSLSQGNTLTDFGNTGTFSAYASVSGTVYGILARNTTNYNISFNSITSSVGGTTAGSLRGIYVPAASNAPTGTLAQTINSNSISLRSGVAGGAVQGIAVDAGTSTATSSLSINSNDFTNLSNTVSGAAAIIGITNGAITNSQSINNNTFTNISCNTTSNVSFIVYAAAGGTGTQTVSSNSIVTAFNKTGAGGTVSLAALAAGASVAGATITHNLNNFSNITVTGATTISGWTNTDVGTTTTTKNITNNTFSSWTGGSSAITGINISGAVGTANITGNTVSNITGGAGTITGMSISSAVGTSTVTGNTVSNITGTGGVTGISSTAAVSANTSSNTIFGLTTSGASNVIGLVASGTTATIAKNKIYTINGTGVSSVSYGLQVTSGTTTNVYNNIVSGITSSNTSSYSSIFGMTFTLTGTCNIYFNTIYIGGSAGITGTGATGLMYYSSGTANNIKNNLIYVNVAASASTNVAVVRRSVSGTANTPPTATVYNADKNVYYAPSSANTYLYAEGTSTLTNGYAVSGLTASTSSNLKNDPNFNASSSLYRTFLGSSREVGTYTENTSLSASAGVVTPSGLSFAESGGIPISTPSITDDYSGTTRNATTPDIGAIEFTGTAYVQPTINSLTTNITGTQCTAVSRTATINITPGTTLTSVTLYYSVNGGTAVAVPMTGGSTTATSNWVATIPVPSPTNATITWYVATVVSQLTINTQGTSYTDEPLFGYTLTASATPTSLCAGSTTNLTSSATILAPATIGAGTTLNSTTTPVGGIYPTYWGNGRQQILILASELMGQNFVAGNFSALSVNVTATGTPAALTNYTIKMAHTTAIAITTFQTPTFTTVYNSASYTPTIGTNTHNYSTPFTWDGTSNVLVDICYANSVVGTTSATMPYTTTAFGSVVQYYADNAGGAGACSTTTVSATATNRPNLTLTGIKGPSLTYSWSDGTSTIGNTQNVSNVTVNSTKTYTVTGTGSGCSLTGSVLVSANPLPTITLGSNPSVCSGTTSANLTYSATTGTPNQYSVTYDATAITAGFVSVTNTTLPSTTIVLTVPAAAAAATYNATLTVRNSTTGCVSAVSNITVTVNALPAITGTLSICGTGTTQLTGSGVPAGSNPWVSASTGVATVDNTGLVTGVSAGTSVITYTDNNGCQRTATVTVDAPSVGGTIAGSATVCAGTNSTTLTLSGHTGSITKWQSSTASDFSAALTDIVNTTTTLTATNLTVTTYYRAVVQNGSCAVANSSTGTVTVNPLPVAYNVTGGGAYCTGGTGFAVGLDNSASGVNYQLKKDGVDDGSPVAGTGSAISFGTKTVAGTYTVVATNATTTCSATMTGNAIITVNARPSVTTTKVDDLCMNNNGSATLTVTGGTPTYTITWTNGGAQSGTISTSGGTLTAPSLSAGVSYGFLVTDANGCTAQ